MVPRRYLSILFLLALNAGWASCGEILIDDFEDGDISDWIVPYSPGKANLTLTAFAANGSYAVNSSGNPVEWGWNDFTKENLGLTLPHPISYYNLSFWYYIPSGVSINIGEHAGGWWVYLGYNDSVHTGAPYIGYTQEFHPNDSINEYGKWSHFSMAIDENFNDPTYQFVTYDSDRIGSIYFLPQPRGGYMLFDDIRLVPKQVTDEGWSCSDWGLCSLGVQSRQCTEFEYCSASRPNEQIPCVLWEVFVVLGIAGIGIATYFLKPKKVKRKARKKKR